MNDDKWNLIPQIHYDAAEIRRSVKIEDAIKQYVGAEPNRAGFIKCPDPTHKDDKPSCKVYTKTNNCKCFSCNGYFTVFDLAAFSKGLDRKSDFPILCEEICNDFGIDKYSVSNLRERELAMEQVFGETKKTEYKEFFPLTETELNKIGLFNDDEKFHTEDYKYSISANSYFKEILGFNEISKIPEIMLNEYGLLVKNGILCAKDGQAAKIRLTFNEAVEVGLELPHKEKNYKPFPRIQDLWKDEENRDGIEKMIVGYFMDAYSEAKNKYDSYKKAVNDYESTHDIEREEKLCRAYDKREKTQVKFSSSQIQRVNDYVSYSLSKTAFEKIQNSFADFERIEDKLAAFFQRRAEHEAETNVNKNGLEME